MLLLKNLRTAVAATRMGHTVEPVKKIPMIKTGLWLWTPESCLSFTPDTRSAVRAAFYQLDDETQHRLTYAPRKGELLHRARLWKSLLRSLPSVQQREAMAKILHWHIDCAKIMEGKQ